MILALALSITSFECEINDAACWRTAALEQEERAERAEKKAALLDSAVAVAERMTIEERDRGDRWHKAFLEVKPAPPGLLDSPYFWMGIGGLVAGGLVVATVYGVAPAFK